MDQHKLLRRDELVQRVSQLTQQNLQLRQQTQKLYDMSVQYQYEIDINRNAGQAPQAANVTNQQVDQLILQRQQLQLQLQQSQADFNQILHKVNSLKGQTRSLLYIGKDDAQLNHDQSKLFFNNQIYVFDQIIDQATGVIPPSSSRVVLYSQKVDQHLVTSVFDQIFRTFEFQEANYQICGVELRNNTDIFDSENKLTSFREFNNLIKIPVRNYEHIAQIMGQIQLRNGITFLVEVEQPNRPTVQYCIVCMDIYENYDAVASQCEVLQYCGSDAFLLSIWNAAGCSGLQIADMLQRYQEYGAGAQRTNRVAVGKMHE